MEDTRQISRIVIDPLNPDVVYVGTLGHAYAPNQQRGVFKSIDGGSHWTHSLDLGPEVGISDLAICASTPRLLFAAAWQTHRAPWSAYAPIDGPGSGLYRSQDAGATWTRLHGSGLPAGNWGRVGVDVAPDGKRVYALIEVKIEAKKESQPGAPPSADPDKSGLYRSDDGGDTWVLANSDSRLTSRAWYFNRVTIDPRNPDVLYVPNVALYRSEDGGKTISVLRGAPGGDDYHQLWIDPKNSASMVLGTDQGTSVSLNRGATFSSWYNQPTAQFYHVTTDHQFPYTVYGAQQDSGSAAVPSRTDHGQITARDWFLAGASESGYLVVDPADPNIIYLSGTYGTVERFNKRTSLTQNIAPWPAFSFEASINQRKYRDPWTPALVLSPADPRVLYLGTQYVMKTTDGGSHWETISPDLTGAVSGGDPRLSTPKRDGFGVVYAIAPSPLNPDLIWAGSDTGLIHLTRDAGKNWSDVSPPGLADWSKISMIEASHFDPAVAYAAVDRGRLDDQTPYLYRTRDFGATWQPITAGIPAPAFLRSIREDPQTRGLLFAGTEFGVYASFDDGDHWQSLQLNLPVSSVRDLVIHGDDLVAATFGRSFWILDNITPLRQARNMSMSMRTDANKAAATWLFHPATAVRIDNDSFPGTPLEMEEPAADNPPSGAVIDYFLPSGARIVRLEVFDNQENLVRKFSSEDLVPRTHPPLPVAERWFPKPELLEKTPGAHRFVWNLKWNSSGGSSAEQDSDDRNPAGPACVPGVYKVRLTVDGKTVNGKTLDHETLEQPLQVIMDPRSPATDAVLAQQLQLGRQIFAETLEARRGLAEIASVQKQLADKLRNLTGSGAQLKSALEDAQSAIDAILKNQGDSKTSLNEAYSNLASALQVVESGDRAVPSAAIAVYEESSRQVKDRLAAWTELKQTRLQKLNQQLQRSNLEPIAIAEIEQQVEFLMSR